MRITGWHVDGYGRFHDRRWEDLPPGLTVFHGPNEAGKSTLLSFLRSMLFGLRDGRSSDPAIPPLAGGRHGGVLRIADAQDAAWTIERHGRDLRVLDAGGTVHDEPTLRRILGNVNRDVFEAVFAFGLHELEQLGGLDDDALREQLFAAGLTGGGSSAHEALGALQKRVERVYRPRGESPLKALDDHLKDLRGQRREALEGQAEHGALRRREDELGAELAALEARIDDRRRDRDRLERLDRVWSLLEPLERERGELSRLAGAATVTAADVTAARTADGAADAARSQLDEVEERRAQTAERLAGLSVDEELVGAADALRALDREVPTQRERLLALSGLRGRRERSAEDARTAVADLGPGWDAARVRAIDASLPVRREAERHAEAVARTRVQAEVARERAAEAARRADGALEAERRASDAAAEAERRVGGADGDEGRRADHGSAGAERSTAAVDRAAAAIPEVRGALQDLLVRRSTLRQATDTLEELRAGASRPTRRPAPDTDRTRVPVLLVVAVLSVVAGIGIAVAGQPVAGVVLVVVGLAVGWAERIDRGGAASAQDAAASEAADAEAHAGRVRRQEERVAIEQDVVAGLEAQLRGAGPRADIDPDALVAATSTGLVERRAAEIDALRERLRAFDERFAELREAEREASVAGAAADEAAAAVREADAAADDAARAWRASADEVGLPGSVTAADAVALLQALERAQDAVRIAVGAASAERDAEEALAGWSRAACEVLAGAGRVVPEVGRAVPGVGRPVPGVERAVPGVARDAVARAAVDRPAPDDVRGATATTVGLTTPSFDHEAVLLAVAGAHADAADAVDQEARRVRLAERDREDAAEADRLRERVAVEVDRRDAVLAAAGVPDLDALEQAREGTDRREALTRSVAEREDAVRAAAGAGVAGEALVAEARTGDVVAWSTRRAAHDADLPHLDRERTEAIAARTDALRAREALEASIDLPRIDGEIEQARADAARLLGELRTTVRARELITRTLDAFVRDQQPTVLRDASAWFRRITDGRYTDVRQTLQDRRGKQVPALQVLPAGGAALDPADLSRGTREQLYLALRLALARRTARDATPLPLVVDDVLVNFSPDRARAVADVVAEVAREHQVLFFTCHPATRDLLVEAAGRVAGGGPALRVEELTRAG